MADIPNLDPPTNDTEPALARKSHRRLGTLNGEFKIPADFDTLYQEEIIALFEGRIQ